MFFLIQTEKWPTIMLKDKDPTSPTGFKTTIKV